MTRKSLMQATAAATLLLCGSLVHAVPIQWSSAAGGNDHWYDFVRLEGINWFSADAAATSSTHLGLTGHLATIGSADENAFVFSLIDYKPFSTTNKGSIWLGGFQPDGAPDPDGGWTWVTGEAWSYTNWASVEPNDTSGVEQYLTFDDFTEKAGTWNDWAGTNGASGYVIEYSPVAVPEPGMLTLLGLGWLGFGFARARRT